MDGYFPYEELSEEQNHFLERLTPARGDLRYLMSGRCAIYYALMDFRKTDQKRVAYVPIYTCETVLAPFQKAGYELLFYDFDRNMIPVFDPDVLDRISLISICGYYGFSGYDRDFVAECSRRGIGIIEDTTHSIFSEDGIDSHCDYVVGSFRKWIGVASGGFAIKQNGTFAEDPLPPNEEHLKWRKECIGLKDQIDQRTTKEQEALMVQGDELFWKSEMQLRRIFDSFGADPDSVYIMEHYPIRHLRERRRSNYRYLLEHLNPSTSWRIVFPELPEGTVPSHMTFFASDRESLRQALTKSGIGCTTYWPVGPLVHLEGHPDAAYIYDHVCSVPCDQRYDESHMQEICDVLNAL